MDCSAPWVITRWGQNARRSLGHVGYPRRAHHKNAAGDAQVTAKAGASATGLRSHPSLQLRPSGHAHGPDGPDRPSGLGREAGPLGQCAAGVQPSRHPPGDPAAGAAP